MAETAEPQAPAVDAAARLDEQAQDKAINHPFGESRERVEAITLDMARLAELEAKYLNASPEVKERASRTIERGGPIVGLIKRANGFQCQLCAALGRNPIGFTKKNGEPYVEAHHVMPVCQQQIGSLRALNVMTLCANHHREVHFGCVEIVVKDDVFELLVAGERVQISRFKLPPRSETD